MKSEMFFNGRMIKEIVLGNKSCTRRIVSKDIVDHLEIDVDGKVIGYMDQFTGDSLSVEQVCSLQLGRSYPIREQQSIHRINDKGNKRVRVHFKADDSVIDFEVSQKEWDRLGKYDYTEEKFISPYWTTKETSRLSIIPIFIKIDRLQNMLIEDIAKEGFSKGHGIDEAWYVKGKEEFINVWNSTVKETWQEYEANPWVWVIEFRKEVRIK